MQPSAGPPRTSRHGNCFAWFGTAVAVTPSVEDRLQSERRETPRCLAWCEKGQRIIFSNNSMHSIRLIAPPTHALNCDVYPFLQMVHDAHYTLSIQLVNVQSPLPQTFVTNVVALTRARGQRSRFVGGRRERTGLVWGRRKWTRLIWRLREWTGLPGGVPCEQILELACPEVFFKLARPEVLIELACIQFVVASK